MMRMTALPLTNAASPSASFLSTRRERSKNGTVGNRLADWYPAKLMRRRPCRSRGIVTIDKASSGLRSVRKITCPGRRST